MRHVCCAMTIAALAVTAGCYRHVMLDRPMCFVVPMVMTETPAATDDFVKVVLAGWHQWARHLPGSPEPQVVATPYGCEHNAPIEFDVRRLRQGTCGIAHHAFGQRISIAIQPGCEWDGVIAHEIGHVLLESNAHVEDRPSVMSRVTGMYPVLPGDMKLVCERHPEVDCPEFSWCEESFALERWCPSESPEAGLKRLLEDLSRTRGQR